MPRKKHRPATRPPPLKSFPRKAILELNLKREVGVWVTVTWGKGAISYPRGKVGGKKGSGAEGGEDKFQSGPVDAIGKTA